MGNKTRNTGNLVTDSNIFVDVSNDRVGIGSTQPKAKLEVAGIVSATSFTGSLTGTASTATNVTVAMETTDTTNYVMFSQEGSGDIPPKTSSSLMFNAANGTLTATTFVGDGSGLTGVGGGSGGTAGVIVRDGGTLVGTAGTIDFGTNISVSPISIGVVTVTAAVGAIPGISTAATTELTHLTVAGVSTFTGSIDVDGHTELDNVNVGGAITATTFTGNLTGNVTGNVSGSSGSCTGNSVTATTASTATNITVADESSDTACNIVYTTAATGNQPPKTGSNLTFNSSNGALTAGSFIKSGGTSSQYLMADGSTTTGTGGSASNSFETISVSGQSNVVADSSTDTLTLVAGSNMTITTNASGDSITFASSGGGGGSGISTVSTNVQATWDVTSSGSSGYVFAGPGQDGAEVNPTIYLHRGQRYRFVNNSGGSHPFQIRIAPNNSAYSDGVTNNGASSGNVEINVQHDAPGTLYYQCTVHSSMVGKIVILGDPVSEGNWTASGGTAQTIDTTHIQEGFSVEYTIMIENGTNRQCQKVLAMHDLTTAYYQEYAIMHKTGLLATMSVDINSNDLRLRATPESGVSGSTTYRVVKKVLR